MNKRDHLAGIAAMLRMMLGVLFGQFLLTSGQRKGRALHDASKCIDEAPPESSRL